MSTFAQIRQGLLALLLMGWVPTPARSGSVFLTGHDSDYHAGPGGDSAAARHIVQRSIAFAMDASFNPFVAAGVHKFLFVESNIEPPPGYARGLDGIVASGFVQGVDFDVHDAATLDAAMNRLGSEYSAIVVASDFGGVLSQAELDILNSRLADISTFLALGGGLVAFAESNGGDSGTPLTPNGGQFEFVPGATSVPLTQGELAFTLTPYGTSLGLTLADVRSGNASHNYFTATSGMLVVDADQFGHAISLARRDSAVPVNLNSWGEVKASYR